MPNNYLKSICTGAALIIGSTGAAVAKDIPEELLISNDGSLVVATAECTPGSGKMCGFVIGVPGSALIQYKDDFCFQPIFWDLEWSEDDQAWINGKIMDFEDLDESYNLIITFKRGAAELYGYGSLYYWGETYTWRKVTKVPGECPERDSQ